jgi:protoporphyrinogen/coproporphyrinogen III oxidase
LVGVQGDPVFVKHTFWPKAIPQYQIGYERHLEKMTSLEESTPNLFVGGQCRDGISLPDCCTSGDKMAQRVVAAAAKG